MGVHHAAYAGRTVTVTKRQGLIAAVTGFSNLPRPAIEQLAAIASEEHHPAGAVVMLEGHVGDRFAIIVGGRAEVSMFGSNQKSIPVCELGPGDSFGEVALLEPGARRSATVTAIEALHLLTIDAKHFRELIESVPAVQDFFENFAEKVAVSNFLKLSTPFGALTPAGTRALSEKLERVTMPAGSEVIRQGERGSTCYLVRAGKAEVVLADQTGERRLATLGRGSLFGEASLLMDVPRNATVRAIEPLELLVLNREDLLAALGSDAATAKKLFELLQVRGRPRQAQSIEVHPRTTADGSNVYFLKNPAKGTYYKLTDRGWFIWQRLDGSKGMRELVLAYLAEFKTFEPGVIAQTLRGLAFAGFLDGINLNVKMALSLMRLTWGQKLLLRANSLIDWRWTKRGVDPFFRRGYDSGIRILFSRASLACFALISAAGLVAFWFAAPRGKAAVAADPALKWLIVPAWLLGTVLHEAAHAFTTKHFRREVNGVGVGWYRFGPVAFIDTSDMWLAPRWERIAVTIAGPAMNLILAGIASLCILVTSNHVAVAALWQFATITYILVLLNLNPLLELDGYYLLMDWLERPNLRTKALAWLTREFPSAIRDRAVLRAHRVELFYGIGTITYVTVTSIAVAISFHQFSRQWISRWFPALDGDWLSYVLAAALLIFFFARIAGDLRGEPRH